MSGPAKCPTCRARLEGVEPQRLRTRGAAPKGAQLYVVPCPRCGASVPFAAATANAMASRGGLPRARTSAERSTPRRDRAPEGAWLAGRSRLSAVDEVGFDPGGRPLAPNMHIQLCRIIESACRPAAGIRYQSAVPRLREPGAHRASVCRALDSRPPRRQATDS
jgi:hypothetical protein